MIFCLSLQFSSKIKAVFSGCLILKIEKNYRIMTKLIYKKNL